MSVTALKTNTLADTPLLEPLDGPCSLLRDKLNEAIYFRDCYIREAQTAEAELAHLTARVQKRKTTIAKYEASILEMRVKVHMLGMDRDFGKDLMGG